MIVGITGKAGSGKDTAADYLVQRHGFVKLSFATPIKAALNVMFGWTDEHWLNRNWKEQIVPELGKSPRQLAQTLGTEWGRILVKEDLWPALTMLEAAKHKNVVIADVRFDNEASAIHAAGGAIVGLLRVTDVASHVSESPINPQYVNVYINNCGSINALHMGIASVINELHMDIVVAINELSGGTAWQSE